MLLSCHRYYPYMSAQIQLTFVDVPKYYCEDMVPGTLACLWCRVNSTGGMRIVIRISFYVDLNFQCNYSNFGSVFANLTRTGSAASLCCSSKCFMAYLTSF